MIELSKSQKKIAREVIHEGLNIECKTFLDKTEKWMKEPYRPEDTPHSKYLKLFEEIGKFDEQIAFRYDRLSSSKYLITVACLIFEKTLPEETVMRFSEEVQREISKLINIYKEMAASVEEERDSEEE